MAGKIGLFGKLPAAGDFVAINASLPVAQAFQRWIQQENDLLVASHKALPAFPVRFVFRDTMGGSLVGVLVPSRDAVGRTFPLTLMAYVDQPVAVQRFPSLPAAYAPFLDSGAALLAQAETLDLRTLPREIESLPLPTPKEYEEARVWTEQALQVTPGLTILEALFGPLAGGVHYHGIHMFRTACSRFHGNDPGPASIYLECPCVDDVQLAFWLLFARTLLDWRRAPPAFFWTDIRNPDHRLIVSLGSPGVGTLKFLADPSLAVDRLWPMLTRSVSSIEAGRRALAAELRSLEPPAPTAAALLAVIGHPPAIP